MADTQQSREASSSAGSEGLRTLVDRVMAALGALLDIDGSAQRFADLFDALEPIFAYDRALVLVVDRDRVRCVAARPDGFAGLSWTRERWRGLMRGRVAASERARDDDLWPRLPLEVRTADAPALCLPIGIGEGPATLLLLRGDRAAPFGDGLVALARQSAVVALAARAARETGTYASEIQRLTAQLAELRESERRAAGDNRLLRDILDRLPVGIAAQDEHGAFLLANAVACASGLAREDGTVPAERSEPPLLASGEAILRSPDGSTREELMVGPTGERVWLTTRRSVTLAGRDLLLSSSYDVTEHKRIEAELTRRAHFDDLTGLPNRVLIQQYVEGLIARGHEGERRFALAFIDLDNFKQVNDYYSHVIGDGLLAKVAERIRKRLRHSDMLARSSGDEFLLLLEPIAGEDEAHAVIDALIADLKLPFHVEAFEMFTSASIGVSFFPQHGESYEDLRRNADNAMYQAKKGTKGEAVYFSAGMGLRITERMQHEQRLRLAIRDQRFCCVFQPKVDIRTQEVVGFETLVRWRDDDGEFHAPGTFIGLASELGLIDPITYFVLDDTLASIDRLDASFGDHTSVSINIAARQANDLAFMHALIEKLRHSPHAGRMMLELTEDAFVAGGEFQTQILPILREMGVRVSIDDFGTGYSSLSVLSEITADELKIDRSFITNIHQRPRSQSILKAIESLGHALGMSMVAEGIESYGELAYLHAATRIRHAQGYYFSKPFLLDDAPPTRRTSAEGRGFAATREVPDGRGARMLRNLRGGV